MNLDDLLKNNPVILLAATLALIAWASVKFVPSLASLIKAALANRRRTSNETEESEVDPLERLTKMQEESQQAIKALVITLQLSIETTSQRDARIGNLADSVAEQTKALGDLARAISQLALTGNQQSTQIAQQSTQLAEMIGRQGYANQLGEDAKADLTKAVQAVDENKQSIEKQTQRISELKEKIEALEKEVREDFMPRFLTEVQGIRTVLDSLATKSDLTQIGHISDKVNVLEAEVRALILTMAQPKPAEPPVVPSAPAVQSTEKKADDPPKEKPNESTN